MYKSNTTQFSNDFNARFPNITKINRQLHKIPKSYPPKNEVLLY